MDEMRLGLVGMVACNDVWDVPASKLHTRSGQRRFRDEIFIFLLRKDTMVDAVRPKRHSRTP